MRFTPEIIENLQQDEVFLQDVYLDPLLIHFRQIDRFYI